jgi:hypothetical protein
MDAACMLHRDGSRVAAMSSRPAARIVRSSSSTFAMWPNGASGWLKFGRVGTFDAAGPGARFSMRDFLDECVEGSASRAVADPGARRHLVSAGVTPWTDLPLWIPEADANVGGMLLADNRRAVAAGHS